MGTTGTGKSVCLNQYVTSLKGRRAASKDLNKCIIYDVKGEFCGKHVEPGDLIFYPFDQRYVPWSFFNEVFDYPDFDVLCTSLCEPPRESKDVYWYNPRPGCFSNRLVLLASRKDDAES